MADHVSLNEKLECGHKFKMHVEESIRLNDSDAVAYHLLGRWCFEVAGLSWFEKRACAALIGAPPEATYDEALQHLNKVRCFRACDCAFVSACDCAFVPACVCVCLSACLSLSL